MNICGSLIDDMEFCEKCMLWSEPEEGRS